MVVVVADVLVVTDVAVMADVVVVTDVIDVVVVADVIVVADTVVVTDVVDVVVVAEVDVVADVIVTTDVVVMDVVLMFDDEAILNTRNYGWYTASISTSLTRRLTCTCRCRLYKHGFKSVDVYLIRVDTYQQYLLLSSFSVVQQVLWLRQGKQATVPIRNLIKSSKGNTLDLLTMHEEIVDDFVSVFHAKQSKKKFASNSSATM